MVLWSGNTKVYNGTKTSAGVHEARISLGRPGHYLLRLEMINAQNQVFEDYLNVGYNVGFYVPLKWIVVTPTLMVACLLLFTPQGGSWQRIPLLA